ncbi:MAG: triose-phosphate isomerase [Bacteroidetes bacterium]|nr:triose-phosphate isomerase [Bacteroidota bacterium]
MRQKIVAGNWKMNKTFLEAEELVAQVAEALEKRNLSNTAVVLCPPFPYLELATDIAKEAKFSVGAQNVYPDDSGAFTGEVSPPMLASMEVEYCIIGHSERRKYFTESHEFLARKLDALLRHKIIPVFCCGEVLPERVAKKHFKVVEKQLNESLFHLKKNDMAKVVIAYEPVWAIGTGMNATPEQAQEMHAFIRGLIEKKYSKKLAEEITILYGGSCNAKNAKELFVKPDVDGGLIGGASLKAEEFIAIVDSL